MATITQIRGALLEEAVLFLLKKVGYESYVVSALSTRPVDGMRAGRSGLEVRGRGTWHQLDAFAIWKYSPAFMYPLQLIVEAKCYNAHRPVGVETPRNAVGVLKDITENYFTLTMRGKAIPAPRFNYAAAIFSTSGFTRGAIEYAIAHQVFLIQYESVPAIQPLIDAIFDFDESCISLNAQSTIAAIRRYFRASLFGDGNISRDEGSLTEQGMELISRSVVQSCLGIQGSYFGMLQGRWPMHLLRHMPLPAAAFREDSIKCKVLGNAQGEWKFVPVHARPNDNNFFELEFSLPPVVAEMVAESWEDPMEVANIKQQHFSYIDLSGVIGGIRRNIRLELDRGWIQTYMRGRARA